MNVFIKIYHKNFLISDVQAPEKPQNDHQPDLNITPKIEADEQNIQEASKTTMPSTKVKQQLFYKENNIYHFLETFLRKNDSNFYYYCKICSKFRETASLFQIHLKCEHKIKVMDKPPLQCPLASCTARFEIEEKKDLQIHVKSEHMGYCFKCMACGEVFLEQNDQEYHEKNTCPMAIAILSDFPPEDEMMIPDCKKVFWLFSRYLKMKNTGAKSFLCKQCKGKQVDLVSIYDHYEKEHHNKVFYEYLCPIESCRARFIHKQTREIDIIWHLKNAHLTSICNICENRFTDDNFRSFHQHKYHGLAKDKPRDVLLVNDQQGRKKY